MHAALKSWIAAVLLLFASVSAAAPTYWNVFNIEGESDLDAAIVTYATLLDMLNDENRTGLYTPDGSGIFGVNIVDSGSDGTTYWNLFNIEGESDLDAAIVTYATLLDMLNDENRTGLYTPDGSGLFGVNIVGGGFGFDAVTTVPEPHMAWLLLLALGAMHIARRRRRPGPSL